MGIIGGVASILGVAGNVTSTVMSMGATALSFGGKFIKSVPGKLAIGAMAGAILSSKLSDGSGQKGILGQLVDKVKDGFKNFFGAAKASATSAALTVATNVVSAGEDLSASRENLAEMIASDAERGAPVPEQVPAPASYEVQAETEQNTPAGAEPAYGA